jgi:hypothetical protein
MANVSLTDLIVKIRKLTARPSTNQITDATIIDYVNLFYEFDFPQELKLFDFKTTYSFVTQPNQAEYPLTQADRNLYKSFEPPVYCSGYNVSWYQSREQFFRIWPNASTTMQLSVATAVIGAGPYTGTLNAFPVVPGNVLLSVVGPAGNTLVAEDDGVGGFTGDVVAGTINYVTGAISVTWNAVPPAGNIITARWVPYQASRPLAVLYFDNVFTLRPIPDQAYKIDIQTFIQPFAVMPGTDVPVEYSTLTTTALAFLNDYFQLLAYGAARKIFIDSMEMENIANIQPFYKEQLSLAERKSMMQIKTQRTSTIYSDNMGWGAERLPTI